jgi:threonine synthase
MQYYSLNKLSPNVDFKAATINGQAPDKGLYFPENIPQLSKEWFDDIANKTNEQIAFDVIQPYVGDAISAADLREIVNETINFEMPLVKINDNIFSLEMYHGPTLAFKDIGARFMSRCLKHFVKDSKKKVTVLVATSGDTGGAVANGFYNVAGVEVVILYPSGKVSSVQEKQLTTLGNNIKALEVNGSFDDCQAIVKQAFLDTEINEHLFLTSANSINVARWLPQQFYYFFAYKQWKIVYNTEPVVSVPSGNFGNICAGLLAKVSGLPIKHFIAACNANAVVPHYLLTEKYEPQMAIPTISNAMDVGNPSNFVRIMQLFQQQFSVLKNNITGYEISDDATKETLLQVYKNEKYLLDPHGAVAYNALENYLQKNNSEKGFIIETAHPVKFFDVVEPIINEKIPLPKAIEAIIDLDKKSILVDANFEAVKEILLSSF